MISDDIIRQSAHKQMLEALPKPSRRVFPPTYYLYRAFKFVMLMTPCVSMQEGAREGLNESKCTSEAASRCGADGGTSRWTRQLRAISHN